MHVLAVPLNAHVFASWHDLQSWCLSDDAGFVFEWQLAQKVALWQFAQMLRDVAAAFACVFDDQFFGWGISVWWQLEQKLVLWQLAHGASFSIDCLPCAFFHMAVCDAGCFLLWHVTQSCLNAIRFSFVAIWHLEQSILPFCMWVACGKLFFW